VKVWDAATGKLLATLTNHTGAVRCAAFSRGGDMIASGSADKTVRVWEYRK
jgi:WD40 repeat protein